MLALLAFAWPSWAIGLLTLLFVAISLILVLTVLIQKPQGGGLSGAFGSGAGSGQTAFGTKTGDALTVATIIIFSIYIVLGIVLVFAYRPQAANLNDAASQQAPAGETAPAETTPADGTKPAEPAGAEPAKPPTEPAGGAAPAPSAPANPADSAAPAPAAPAPASPTPAPK